MITLKLWMRHAKNEDREALAAACNLKLSTLWAFAGGHNAISDHHMKNISLYAKSLFNEEISFSSSGVNAFLYVIRGTMEPVDKTITDIGENH